MMKSDTLYLQVVPDITEMTSSQYNPISQYCSLNEKKSKGIIAGKNLSHVCSPNNIKSYRVIVNESYTDESICKSVHKSINTKKHHMKLMKQRMKNLWLHII